MCGFLSLVYVGLKWIFESYVLLKRVSFLVFGLLYWLLIICFDFWYFKCEKYCFRVWVLFKIKIKWVVCFYVNCKIKENCLF